MKDEALKLALEALKIARDQIVDPEYAPIGWSVSRLDEVLANGQQALATPVQEPVTQYSDIVSDGGLDPRNKFDTPSAAQRQWVGLSPADRGKCLSAGDAHGWIGVMEATEAKLKEKNT